jgi:hypothetical protein
MSDPWCWSTKSVFHDRQLVKRIYTVTWILGCSSVWKERTIHLGERHVQVQWSRISEILDLDRTNIISGRRI